MKIHQKLFTFHGSMDSWPEEFRIIQEKADPFIKAALEAYFANNNVMLPQLIEGGEEV